MERKTVWLETHLEQLGWWWSGSSHYLSQCAVRAGSATRSAPHWLRHRPRPRFRRNPLVRRWPRRSLCQPVPSTNDLLPTERSIGRLAGGDSVVVYERKGEWARVSAQGVPAKWVSSKLLCSGSGCYRPTNRPVSSSRKNLRPARSDYSDGSCPCSGSRVCIGPRGGRYCITSGGNKRYGV